MNALDYVNAATGDNLGFRRLSFEEVEWLMERNFTVGRTVFGDDIVSFSSSYIHEVLHPGTTWGHPDFKTAEVFMDRLWQTPST